MDIAEKRRLEALCAQMRSELVDVLYAIQTGHPGGSLSCCEILATLYFHTMRLDPKAPDAPNRDRLVLSKGHAAPMLYLCLAHRGFIPMEAIPTLRQTGSMLQGHPTASKVPGVDLSTGALGLGLSAGNGMAAAARLFDQNFNVFVVLGDGELQEGCIWEAAMTASKFRLNNIVAILDHNGVQVDGANDEIMPLGDIRAKFEAFGWAVFSADGHDVASLSEAYQAAIDHRLGPAIVIAETIKGKGVSFMHGKNIWHGKPLSREEYLAAKNELGSVVS